jgi:DeoR family transcriptional regulator, glycerol-3-phosphate regulon repressor
MTDIDAGYALNERQSRIVERVDAQGFVTIDALARDFAVSAQTIRREIIRLEELGVVQRFHGGAGRKGSGERLSYELKQTQAADLKRRIGAAMAGIIRDGAAVFIDVGTTAEAFASALLLHQRLTVVTPSAAVARILAGNSGINVVATGGRVVGPDLSMVGPIAQRTVAGFRFDWAVISCSGIDARGDILDFDADKIALKQTAMQVAGKCALIADSTKFGRNALLGMGHIGEFDILATDATPPKSVRHMLADGRVLVAS